MAIDLSALDGYALEKVSELEALAEAIRAKTGITDKLTVLDMAREVNLIEVKTIDYLTYAEYEDGYEVTGLNDESVTDIVIPSTYNGKAVIRIADAAFDLSPEFNAITSVIIPNSVTSIGYYAFFGRGFASITIPDSVKSIDGYAFGGCTNLKTVTFKGIPTTIATTIFSSCTNLTDINVPWTEGEVSGSPWGAENADIDYEYKNTPNVQSLTITENGEYTAPDGVDGYSPITVNVASSGGMSEYDERALQSYINVLAFKFMESEPFDVVIPKGATYISDFISYTDMINTVTIPSSVTSISSTAFAHQNAPVTDIYIHKAENSITGSPWGATNASIHWLGSEE